MSIRIGTRVRLKNGLLPAGREGVVVSMYDEIVFVRDDADVLYNYNKKWLESLHDHSSIQDWLTLESRDTQ